ncbi:MAG: hypothetical protein QM725_17400 [Lacibacter sp.]
MKKIIAVICFLIVTGLQTYAQKEKGFDKEKVFVGTGINLGFFNGFILGLNPEIGYSLNRFIDAGVATNMNYITQNDPYSSLTYRQFAFGGGPFIRIWPASMFFIGGQFEYNSINYSVKENGVVTGREKFNAPSILVGGGYGNRLIGQSQFSTSIMVDILKADHSPYIDSYGRLQPVFRTTFTFYLRDRKRGR